MLCCRLTEFDILNKLSYELEAKTSHREKAEDGKSYVNPTAEKRSEAYSSFVSPIDNGRRGGFELVSLIITSYESG